ncbi:DUF2771 domain-containing protein, partial [Corynebacterium durum]
TVAVIAVVAISITFQRWWNNRPGPEPRDIQLTVSAPSGEQKISPFTVCEPGTTCAENSVPEVHLGEQDKVKVTVPKEVYDQGWSLLTIYDDPAANDQSSFKAHEKQEVEVSGSAEPRTADSTTRPRLVVVEISTAMVGHNDAGEETPYSVVWSVKVTD